jgi:TRAP-type mannitol/chloroaromatic compound transport system permease small subunit
MNAMLKVSHLIDGLNDRLGRGLMWLILAAVLISAGNAIVRKAFDMSSNALLEIQWYLFASVFMLGSGFAFLKNAHVRIDFISNHLSAKTRNLIDMVGIVVFLFPLCYMLIVISWPLFVNAWNSGEMSQNAGGLIRWPMYALIPLGFMLLALQGLSELIKRAAFIAGLAPDAIGHVETAAKDEIGHEIEEHAAHVREEVR